MDIQSILSGIGGQLRRLKSEFDSIRAKSDLIEKIVTSQRSITAEIDAIPGRRIYYNLTGVNTFTIADDARRGQPITMLVSQDGPFIQTHYPMAIWRPSAPATATMLGLWRPVTAWPLADQFAVGTTDGDTDIISISYEVVDGGSQRNFQNEPVPPVLSRPDLLVPLSVPTLYTPNTSIQFFPTYERILFNNTDVAPTEGTLVVALPGYRIVNL